MKDKNFTAIVACCDEVAMAAISVGYSLGLTVPKDFSIIGFDNTSIAEMAFPPLTTISQPLFSLGKTAFLMLFEKMSTGKDPESKILPFKIVERRSVAQN